MAEKDDASQLSKQLDEAWTEQSIKLKPSFLRAFIKVFRSRILIAAGVRLVAQLGLPLMFLFVKIFIDYIEDPMASAQRGLLVFLLVFSLNLFMVFVTQIGFLLSSILGITMRKALVSVLYRKVIRLSHFSLSETTTGRLISLSSGDMDTIQNLSIMLVNGMIGPIVSILTFFILYYFIGYIVFICLAIGVVLLFLQLPISRLIVKTSLEIGKARDSRLSLMNSLLQGIETIKCYCWEQVFEKQVLQRRELERRGFNKLLALRGFDLSFFRGTSVILWMPLFLLTLTQGQKVNAATIYVAMPLITMLNYMGISFLTQGLMTVSQYYAIIQRYQDVLRLDQIDEKMPLRPSEGQSLLELKNVSSLWENNCKSSSNKSNKQFSTPASLKEEETSLLLESDTDNIKFELSSISIEVERGKLVGVFGRTGSGKSTLLATILNQTTIKEGSVECRGRTAYVQQQPCILSDTVRSNITFGLPLDQQRLARVIRVCQLEEDLPSFPQGLDTKIGQMGVTISGGQKARISLARACYSDSDIYLIDDPLSCVDLPVAERIFSDCIKGFLKDKAIILVTHRVQFMQEMDEVVALDKGRQIFRGPPYKFRESTYLQELVEEVQMKREKDNQETSQPNKREEAKEERKQIIKDEGQSEGRVKTTTCFKYLKGAHPLLVITTFLLSVLPLFSQTYLRLYITHWIDLPTQQSREPAYTYYYIALSLGAIVVSIVSALFLVLTLFHLSNSLHHSMLGSVLRSPSLFFWANPLGRIINRFARDQAATDGTLPISSTLLLDFLFQCVMLLFLSILVLPYIGIVAFFAIVSLIAVRRISIIGQLDSLRMDGISRSPINSLFSSSLQSVFTIRAYNQSRFFRKSFQGLVDTNGRAFFTYQASSRWMCFYFDVVNRFFVLACMGLAFIFKSNGTSEAYVSLCLTSALTVFGPFQTLITLATDIQNQMTSVQRMHEYSSLPVEPGRQTLSNYSVHSHQATLEFKGVTLRYGDQPNPALNSVSFEIQAGMKIGIVGRTGSGKSSLLKVLLRFVQCEKGSDVLINGRSIYSMNIQDLRYIVTLIPQSGVLFECSLAQNLDPLSQKSNKEIWDSLEDVEMREYVQGLEEGLNTRMDAKGSGLSEGQKQLLCLARAMLREHTQILVMDESTANVDVKTEGVIRRSVMKRFKEKTVVIVSHRIENVDWCDRVLVMESGKVKAFGAPSQVLH